jgi:hypothetical protein
MLRGELHNRGSAGRCGACGEPFPCPTGLAIFETDQALSSAARSFARWGYVEDVSSSNALESCSTL